VAEVLRYAVAQAGRIGAALEVLGSVVVEEWTRGATASTAAGGRWGEEELGAGGGLQHPPAAAATRLLFHVGSVVIFFL
jgi:hypothetical protein